MFKVTNNNTFDFEAKFNGVSYYFPKGKPVYLEDVPAVHIFAIGQENKVSVLARHGWATPTSTVEDGLKILNNFTFVHREHKLDANLASEASFGPDEPKSYGPAPVVQGAPDGEGASPVPDSSGVVAESKRPPKLGFARVFTAPQTPQVELPAA